MLSIPKIRSIAAFTTLLTLFLVGLGGFVRATGAGLACPDWPLCYGRVVPPGFGGGVFQEVFHRYTAGIVSIITIVMGVLIHRERVRFARLWTLFRSVILILAIQVVMGGLTVLLKLNPFIVTGHLALGTLYFLCWGAIATDSPKLLSSGIDSSKCPTARATFLLLCLTFVQVLLGGFVGSSGASLACPDLPLCTDRFLPESASGAQILHMTHRTVGISLLLFSIVTTLLARRDSTLSPSVRTALTSVTLAFLLQIGVGIGNVYWQIPVDVTVTHLVVAELILLTLVLVYRALNPRWRLFSDEVQGGGLSSRPSSQLRESKLGNYN